MKNILIPILVLIFLVGAGIAEALIVNNIFEDFIAETDKLIELAKNEVGLVITGHFCVDKM